MILKDIRSGHESILNDSEENHVFVKSATLQRIIARHQRVATDSQNQQVQDVATTNYYKASISTDNASATTKCSEIDISHNLTASMSEGLKAKM